jgi:hypothetical protein
MILSKKRQAEKELMFMNGLKNRKQLRKWRKKQMKLRMANRPFKNRRSVSKKAEA